MAPSHGVHDHGPDFVRLFSGWLHHLSFAHWREIFRIHRLGCRNLLPDARFARSPCLCDVAVGDFDARSGFSPPMGPARADRALDGPDLALCVRHRSSRLLNALPMVPSARALGVVSSARRVGKSLRSQNLALGDDLMFHQNDAPRRMEQTLW